MTTLAFLAGTCALLAAEVGRPLAAGALVLAAVVVIVLAAIAGGR